MANRLTLALLQLPVGPEVAENVRRAVDVVRQLKAANPQLELAVLPESFNAPYGQEHFPKFAEPVPDGPTCRALSQLAGELAIYVIGGSIVEREGDKLYNTCTVWAPNGGLVGRHRKIHLFTMDIEPENGGGVQFDEAAVLTPGSEPTVVRIGKQKVGIGICHDKRFEELARIYRNMGCSMLVYPSAFCICQGPMHWELLQRARATDNQVFVVTCSPARNNMSGYVAYGHSMVVNPWAQVQREAGEGCEFIVEEIDFDMVEQVRRQIPIFEQRRTDVYASARSEL
ncbi:omega-amidase NIT2-like [Drosophila ficusphila]|uniref:omega-amidase NIT2-like n=1 Tax=Drosophila ficusphila TaxID=30025 RepID=UPI0007E641A0|nr:omega-amidase NIT2-like [Drosophila ficusphila]